jgi:hypothetical protein
MPELKQESGRDEAGFETPGFDGKSVQKPVRRA